MASRAALGALGKRGSKAADYLMTVQRSHQRSLRSLALAFADRRIDRPTFERELRSEKRAMAAELRAAKILGKATARAAVNAFFGVLGQTSSGLRGIR